MVARIKNVCLIASHLGPALAELGIRSTALFPRAGTANLPELLAGLPEPPDCVIQQEDLGHRLLLTGLEAAPCPTLFWSLDTHLNFFWQRHYARAFSAVATTQPHFVAAFRAAGASRVAWVPWHGTARPLAPLHNRPLPLAFAGRITAERRRRQWFADHMARYDLTVRQDVFGQDLGAFYDSARLAPNECIAGEINLRLFEAASSGCLPVSERQPEAVTELFLPDTEALYYEDVLELDDRLHFALSHPGLVAKMGQAAHAAVKARHLPRHRAASLLALAETATAPPADSQALAASTLALYHLHRSGQLPQPPAAILKCLSEAPGTPEILAARMQTSLDLGETNAVLALAALCLSRPELAGHPLTATACTLAAWRLGAVEEAKRAYVALAGHAGHKTIARLTTTRDYLLFFAGVLAQAGYLTTPGMLFDPKTQLPENATECLLAAEFLQPGDPEIERRLELLLRQRPGSEVERVGLLSNLTLHRPDDWGLGLELALANLHAFRREAGVEECAVAQATARRRDQENRFTRRLAAADPTGRLRRALVL